MGLALLGAADARMRTPWRLVVCSRECVRGCDWPEAASGRPNRVQGGRNLNLSPRPRGGAGLFWGPGFAVRPVGGAARPACRGRAAVRLPRPAAAKRAREAKIAAGPDKAAGSEVECREALGVLFLAALLPRAGVSQSRGQGRALVCRSGTEPCSNV